MRWNTKLAVKTLSLALGTASLVAAGEANAFCYWNTVSSISSGHTSTVVVGPGHANGAPAFTVTPDPAYHTISNSSWINYNPTTYGDSDAWASYYANLYVPDEGSNTNGTRLKLEVNADNVAWFYINYTKVYEQSWGPLASNFQSPSEVAYVYEFTRGWNLVKIDVYNFAGPTGLNFRISVEQYSCSDLCTVDTCP